MTDCPACKVAGKDHDEIVALCKSSPYWAGLILGDFDWFRNSFHQSLAQWFVEKHSDGRKRFIVMTARDHLKTTLFSVSTALWYILNDPEVRILIMMSSGENADKTLDVIKDILLYSETLKHFFPHLVLDYSDPQMRSKQGYLKLKRKGRYRDGTIEARGIDSKITGGHFNVHIFDDLIDEKMISSPTLQQNAIDFVRRSDALFVKAAEDTEIIIGTRWPGPFYRWLLDESGLDEYYETLVIGCRVDDRYRDFMAALGKRVLLEDGDPVWPEHFTDKSLRNIELRADPYSFAHQWYNLEISDVGRRFNRSDFQFYDRAVDFEGVLYEVENKAQTCKFKNMYRTMTIDPATGEHAGTDNSAISVCGFDRKTGRIFVLEEWAGKVLPFDLIDKIIEIAQRWKPHVVSPEQVSFQTTLTHFLRQEMQKRGINFRIRPVKPGNKAKAARIIDALQPFVANRQLYVARSMSPLVDEMVNLQIVEGKIIGKSPNRADALAYHAEHWKGIARQLREDSDDIDFVDAFRKPVTPAYGLQVRT